ncbi:MAG: ISAs1 family transposase [Caldilineaceae bacterium]|nr:ISAs1 family transposase [Caldilineaceae bacterium]
MTIPVPLVSLLAAVDDPRRPQGQHHSLEAILLITTLAVICGADHWTEVEFFGHQKQAWLETFLELPHGIPSHDTFGRVFGLLDPAQLEACFVAWVQSLAATLQDEVVAVDGKAARGSHDQARSVSPLHLVSAWADAARLVLGQRRVDDRSNEITAIPALLETLALEGCIVTIDAMGCQKRIAETIRDQGADYVLALKGNQPQLHEAVVETFAVEQAEAFEGCDHDFHQTVNKNHGRIETRRCWVIGTPEYIRYVAPDEAWPDLQSLVMIEAQRRQGDQVTAETRYYISSLPADARVLLQVVRSHWGIENSLHWVLDMAFREDESRIRTGHAAHNLSILRRMALNLLRRETTAKGGIAAKRKQAGWNDGYLLKVLSH